MAPIEERLAGAPISWGACEVPGWGVMPGPEAVLSDMAQLGPRGTDTAITGHEPTVAGGPMRDARESVAFFHHMAHTTEEINR